MLRAFLRRYVPQRMRRAIRGIGVWFYCACEVARLLVLGVRPHKPRVFYLGTTEHTNLGDLAQYDGIRRWIRENYPSHEPVEFGAMPIVEPTFRFPALLKKIIGPNDLVVFQSGYTTEDLGGNHELMHRLIINAMPNVPILMMPQTIFFQSERNRARCAQVYNRAEKMLFLARDRISFADAEDMFPDVCIRLFPDIVTTRIGERIIQSTRDGILLCCRNDSEKFYSQLEIERLAKQLAGRYKVSLSDTRSDVPFRKLKKNVKWYIDKEIERFAQYAVVITDRYHGTIFALAANTPVIVLRTTDHKVVTGVEWFRGLYDDFIFSASSLDEVISLAGSVIRDPPSRLLPPYFREHYYDKLALMFQDVYRS